jgi:hypothetical protein
VGEARQDDRAVIAYWVPVSLAGEFLCPPPDMNTPIKFYAIRGLLSGNMIHHLDVL